MFAQMGDIEISFTGNVKKHRIPFIRLLRNKHFVESLEKIMTLYNFKNMNSLSQFLLSQIKNR